MIGFFSTVAAAGRGFAARLSSEEAQGKLKNVRSRELENLKFLLLAFSTSNFYIVGCRLAAVDELLLDRRPACRSSGRSLRDSPSLRPRARARDRASSRQRQHVARAWRGTAPRRRRTLRWSGTGRDTADRATLRRPSSRSGIAYGACTKPDRSKSYGTRYSVRSGFCTRRTLCSAQIDKSVLPIMYSNSIVRVSVSAVEIGERDARQLDDAPFVAARDVVLVLDEQRVARRRLLLRLLVDVGGAREPRAERQRRHHVEQR